jgi:hypothetical protein
MQIRRPKIEFKHNFSAPYLPEVFAAKLPASVRPPPFLVEVDADAALDYM